MFALRCETGAPGRWGPVEAHWQVAPLLIPSGNPALANMPGGYGAHTALASTGAGGLVGGAAAAVANLLPGQTGEKLKGEVKAIGHKLGNFLNRF
ncbi:hypothetical protein MNEG_14942 [Monoraphidium neglectum]|uniref:Uncharacterized protein n=1 Tax=Monoraphidium neglectum TaxID=145388 RepID=A0A0D2MCN3_9CHLO|nr:hypothetical protein MNEG_14942 [Monoraphidium neglectum]KIY93020.1 hypothetical protein MNEG_14942 [Monoraphidium neglectum]|eukprot:XP_013892040.1 hypothetical protein MNEG_14942 [Monoraphidium neglectum]